MKLKINWAWIYEAALDLNKPLIHLSCLLLKWPAVFQGNNICKLDHIGSLLNGKCQSSFMPSIRDKAISQEDQMIQHQTVSFVKPPLLCHSPSLQFGLYTATVYIPKVKHAHPNHLALRSWREILECTKHSESFCFLATISMDFPIVRYCECSHFVPI